MNGRNVLFLALASLFGFIGGTVQTWLRPAQTAAPAVVRATRFELVDDSGRLISFWGFDGRKHLVFTFLDKGRNDLATLGLSSGNAPFLDLVGKDGKSRLILQLFGDDRPLLAMSDGHYEGRIMLGFIQPDTPTPTDDWGLFFRTPQEGGPNLVRIGMFRRDLHGRASGIIAVSDASGKTFGAP